jgi:hypothetical protein
MRLFSIPIRLLAQFLLIFFLIKILLILANLFNEITKINANMEDESEIFRNEFKKYLTKVASYSKSKQDQEEKMILR